MKEKEKNKRNIKMRFLSIMLTIVMLTGVIGCGKSDSAESAGQNVEGAETTADADSTTKDIEQSDQNTETGDAELGLKNTKIDDTEGNLTDEQKEILRYFSGDYMFVNSIEALQRYNKIFDDALISCFVNVAKVVSYDDESYELLVYLLQIVICLFFRLFYLRSHHRIVELAEQKVDEKLKFLPFYQIR